MRRFLVDHARKKNAYTRIPKKGFDAYDESSLVTQSFDNDVVLLDDALRDLEKLDPKQARIVELRFFGGLSEKEVAEMMKVSVSTINREWKSAKMWLMHQIRNV